MPAETLCNSAVDIVVRGDGEETFLSILQGRPLESIRGISYRKGSTVVHNPSANVEMNLDKYPFPAYHLVPMDKYYPAIGAYKRLPAINMLMTRGSPGKCTFCNSAMTTLRSPLGIVSVPKALSMPLTTLSVKSSSRSRRYLTP